MKRQRKVYARPKKPWSKERLDTEKVLITNYGLRRKREIWIVEAKLRDFRQRARAVVSQQDKVEEQKLIKKASQLGLIGESSHVDDVLALKIEDLLDRRLQTIIFKKGIGTTQKQARQFITHGHIAIDGRRIKWPSALITLDDEKSIGIYGNSKLKDSILKMKAEVKKTAKPVKKEGETVEAVVEGAEKVVEEVKEKVEKVAEVVENAVEEVKEKVEGKEEPTVETPAEEKVKTTVAEKKE